jgi:hypothetical protein
LPTIDLPADELAAVTAAIRRAIEDDRFPHAPRLDPLRAALARLDAASRGDTASNAAAARKNSNETKGGKATAAANAAPPPAKADKRAKGSKATAAKAPAPTISPGFKLGRLPPER